MSRENNEQRVALVTGSGKGVGAGIVRVLAENGIRCCINCNSNPAMANKLLEEVKAAGGEAFVYQCDVTKPEKIEEMVGAIIEKYGRLDILVNNAAMQLNYYVEQYDADAIRWLWNINIGGYVRVTKACIPYLKQSPAPSIVNISSVHGKRPSTFDAGYSMTKGAIRMFTRELSLETFSWGCRVNTVDLGGCKIEFKTGNETGKYDAEIHSPLDAYNPDPKGITRGRAVVPTDVGNLVWFLVNETGAGINGAGIRLDNGSMLR